MRIYFLLVVLLIFITAPSHGQVLLLKNNRNFKTVQFAKGSIITYKLKDYPTEWKTAKIDMIGDDYFCIENDIVPLDKIIAVRIERQGLHYKE